MRALAVFILLALGSPTPAQAMFADQAGLNDWTMEHVGLVEHAQLLSSSTLLVGTHQGVVAALDSATGAIAWRAVLPPSEGAVTSLCVSPQLVASTSASGMLRVYAQSDGAVQWDAQTECRGGACECFFTPSGGLVAFGPSSGLQAFDKLGKATWEHAELRGGDALLGGSELMVLSGAMVTAVDVDTGSRLWQRFAASPASALVAPDMLAVRTEAGEVSLLRLSTNASIPLAKSVSRVRVVQSTLHVESNFGAHLFFSAEGQPLVFEAPPQLLRLFPLSPKLVVFVQVSLAKEDGADAGVQGECFASFSAGEESDPNAPQADFTLSTKAWTRHEALATITQTVSTPLPLVVNNAAPSLLSSLAGTLLALLGSLQSSASRFLVQGALSSSVATSSEEEMARFGLARVFVVLTQPNKMFALHSESGAVLWSRQLPADAKPVLFKVSSSPPRVFAWDAKTAAVLASVDAATGQDGGDKAAPGQRCETMQTVPLRNALAVLCKDLRVLVLPAKASQALREAGRLYFYVASDEAVSGYAYESGFERAFLVWTHSLPAPLAALAAMQSDEVVGSSARVLGDSTVLVKYINKHWIALASVDPDQGLRVTSLDAVSGRVLAKLQHRDGTGPVHMVRFEHWLVVTFWNAKSHRVEFSVTTLYERALGKRAVNPWTPLPAGLLDVFDSLEKPSSDLITFQRTFSLSGQQVSALGVTQTRRGIAAKNLLVGLSGGQVLMLDQRLVDPRRTAQPPSPEETAEGLFQYQPELPVLPVNVLSYFKAANRIRAFAVAPARLESTCHVLAVGLDVFKGRASPSGTFDLLAEDFNYSLLGMLMVGLTVGVVVLRRMEKTKALKDAWL